MRSISHAPTASTNGIPIATYPSALRRRRYEITWSWLGGGVDGTALPPVCGGRSIHQIRGLPSSGNGLASDGGRRDTGDGHAGAVGHLVYIVDDGGTLERSDGQASRHAAPTPVSGLCRRRRHTALRDARAA